MRFSVAGMLTRAEIDLERWRLYHEGWLPDLISVERSVTKAGFQRRRDLASALSLPRNTRGFQRHFQESPPCALPPCACLPTATRERDGGRRSPWSSTRKPTTAELNPMRCLPDPTAKTRRNRLPLYEHGSGDQQHEEDGQQDRRYEPLTKDESGGIRHIDRLLVAAGARCSQSPITAEGRAVINGI